jgi:hypothetical protein
MPSINFTVIIKRGSREIPITKRSRLISRVMEWYKERFEFLADFYKIEITSFEFDYPKDCFTMKFRELDGFEDEPHLDEMFADPDDDGNYPIRAYGADCLVIGQVV